ncbi:MAG: hypothetical protein IPP90_07810 [Gemmatimonadaceae bacterium]|nr:hypothetical protein [Gemmatimonadaceae bacterium]
MSPRELELPQDFLEFITMLNAHQVEYVIVGGYALGAHGYVRATGDIDFLYRLTSLNVTRLCAALGQFGAPSQLIDHTELLDPDAVTFFGVPPYRIDLMSSISGVESESVFATAIEDTMAGQRVRVIGRQALETNKRASGRDKDLRDLRALARMDKQRR